MNAKFAALALLASSTGLCAQSPADSVAIDWNARHARHLLNRAGFGARPGEIAEAVRAGHGAYVDQLLDGFGSVHEPYIIDLPARPNRPATSRNQVQARTERKQQIKRDTRGQLGRFAAWWIGLMIDGRDPLRERMTLFWHGHFTSAYRDLNEVVPLIEQNELFRRHALGDFGQLTREILNDHAMIRYLDNEKNEKTSPNENLARELMELFTLGEGNYDDDDVKEAARALTGHSFYLATGMSYSHDRHDDGEKTILGQRARFDGESLVDLLLDQPACSRLIAGKLLTYFEGREPGDERHTSYANYLREVGYEIGPFLRRLFMDPAFYSDEVVGGKIAAPIEFIVGHSRRLDVHPPPRVLWVAAGQLGQRLLDPPNVKGWEGGMAWMTSASLLQRGNVMGMLLGVVDVDEVIPPEVLSLGIYAHTMVPAVAATQTDPPERARATAMSRGLVDAGPQNRSPRHTAGDSIARAPRPEPVPTRPPEEVVAESDPTDGAPPTEPPATKPAASLVAEDSTGKSPRLDEARASLTGAAGTGPPDVWYSSRISLAERCRRIGATTNERIVGVLCDELLAIDVTPQSRSILLYFLSNERRKIDPQRVESIERGGDSEQLLRRLAHLVLSLPEAQLL
jgi:uncharacterized protein (DUF1800 family)